MKSDFSKTWKASKQPRKQRKYVYNAPLHLRYKFMAATLSKDLRKKHGIRNIEVRKGDEVKIMRGKFKKKTGKVGKVDLGGTRISIDGIERTKKDGAKIPVWFNPSKVMIISLDLDDRKRMKRLKKKEEPKQEKKTEQATKLHDSSKQSKDSSTKTKPQEGKENVHKKK
tara:strand:- start:639 stop:1145 length:507 start_codon:yes stop_codon:yes gene_type:complete